MELVKSIIAGVQPEVFRSLSPVLGESEVKLKIGFAAIVPTILAAILSQIKSSKRVNGHDGIERIFSTAQEMIHKGMGSGPLMFDSSGEPEFSGSETTDDLVPLIFGPEGPSVVLRLQNLSGMSKRSIGALLNMAVPLVYLEMQRNVETAGGKFTPITMSALVSSSAPEIAKKLPAGFGNFFGTANIASLSSTEPDSVDSLAFPELPTLNENRNSSWSTILFLLLLLAVGVFLLYSIQSR